MHPRLFIIVSVAAVVGLAAGVSGTLWYLAGPMQQSSLARMQLDAATNISVLEELRAGHNEAARQRLEGAVDGVIVGLDKVAREYKALSGEAMTTLDEIAKYRATTTYIPSPIAERAGVSQILEAARNRHLTTGSSATPISGRSAP